VRYLPQEIIRLKRDGHKLSQAQLEDFSSGIASGEVSDAQIAAFTMAVCFQDMDVEEMVNWTLAVRDSGRILNWKGFNIDAPIIDKHSTGGVGDCVSLMLAPMLASCGVYIPMIAGRGLSHTGGTIDKLESIPGYNTSLSIDDFQKVVSDVGFSIICQTNELAPTDKRVYAVRDVTSTVSNIGLITASILSKKLAAGLDSLVLDVKTGNGAVIQDLDQSRALAQALTQVSNEAGVKTTALITDMSVPLAFSAGNSVEVQEVINYLKGDGPRHPRLHKAVIALGSQALFDAGISADLLSASAALEHSLSSGKALELFSKMTHAMGGPSDLVSRSHSHLPQAPIIKPVFANSPGFISSIDVRGLGFSVVWLGGGRTHPDAPIDPSVGLTNIVNLGAEVDVISDSSRPLCMIHAATEDAWQEAARRVRNSFSIGETTVNPSPVIHETII
jgi:thymidine phosphorylase